jgi:7-carboxy-7-deazaguanine synthase
MEGINVLEIFSSIDGEGIRTGKLVTFLRVYGCNLRCSFCDTTYSYAAPEDNFMSVEEIVSQIGQLGNKRITLTGGEPLIHSGIVPLIEALTDLGYELNIETNGSVDINTILDNKRLALDKIILTIDWKSISSGMNKNMLVSNLVNARPKDVIKFVVGNAEDINYMIDVLRETKPTCKNIYISPVFGEIEMAEIVDAMKAFNLQDCTLQMQLHKIVWPPAMRGV